MLWLAGVARAEIPAEWLGERVVGARVAGEQAGRIDDAIVGIPAGERLSRALLRATMERLLASGRFSDVQIDAVKVPGGVELQVHLFLRALIRRVEVAGNRVLDDRDVVRLLGVHEEAELSLDAFPKWVADLREAYNQRGYAQAQPRIVVRDMDDLTYKVLRIEIDEGRPTRIALVQFQGDALPRRKGMRRLLGFQVGDIADVEDIEGGLLRAEAALRRQGYYRAMFGKPIIQRSGQAAHVIIPSHVGPPYEVRFIGHAPLKESELFAALALHEERLASDANLRALEQKLAELYRRFSFRDVSVRIQERAETRTYVAEDTGETVEEEVMLLEVHIAPGLQTEVAAIVFPGASHFDTKLLRAQMYSYLEEDLPGSSLRTPVDSELADQLGFSGGARRQEREVPRPILLDPRRMFYAPSYEEAVEHLRELYREDGYLDAQVSDVRLEPLPEPGRVVAVIEVNEGPRTFLYDVHIENNRHVQSFQLLEAAALTRGSPFSYLKLEEARLRVVEACQEQGYFYAKAEPTVRLAEDGTRAEVVFRVEEGYQVRVAAIEVRGHDRSSRAMIENRLRFKPGDLYRPSRARESEDSLLALDVFTSVTVAPEEADLPARLKKVIVSLTERKTQWLGWSAGFSTGEGVRGGFEYGYRNLFRSAVHASFRGQIGYQFVFLDREIERQYNQLSESERIEYQTTLTFGIPYIPSLPKNTASIDLTVLSDIQRDFRIQKQSAVVSLLYRPFRRFTMSVSEELESSDFELLALKLSRPNTVAPANWVPAGQNTLLATQLTIAYDLRDRAYNPRRGVLISFSPEYDRTLTSQPGEGADQMRDDDVAFRSNMLRFLGSFAFYIPLGPKLTFASQWRYGRIVHLEKNSSSYPNRLFYLGGTNFRGYYINQVVPQDVRNDANFDESSIVSHGGETVLAGQNELRFPLYGDLYGGLFSDIGNLWKNPRSLDVRDLMVVVGAGLRLQTPVASLAFDYGVRQIRDRFDVVGAFQFAFQTF